MRRLAARVETIDILASGHVLCDGDGWQITAEGRDFLRALEAVTQDNRLAEAEPCAPEDGESAERPRAALIVVGHRFKTRRHHVPALPARTAFSGEARCRGLTCTARARDCARMRITLIHALKHSIVPIEASFARLWPDARLMNLLDDSLSADLARDGGLTDAMTERFLRLGRYAAGTGSDAILFTCSAFGPCIEAVARAHAPMPVLKPNEAMIEQAVARGRKVGLLSTFPPTLASMPPEFPSSIELVPKLAEGAMAALDRGDRATHDRLVVEASKDLRDCDLIALAQYSMAPAAERVAEVTGRPVLTTPDSAVLKLKGMLTAGHT